MYLDNKSASGVRLGFGLTLPDICKSYQIWVDISIRITCTVWYFRQMCKSVLRYMYQLTGTVRVVQYRSWYRSQNRSSVHSFTSFLTVHDMFDTSSSRWYPWIQLVQYRRFGTVPLSTGTLVPVPRTFLCFVANTVPVFPPQNPTQNEKSQPK